ncbi:MAG TPA: alpha/beta fold hydrolase [Candidatus Baltobacteraceae bacterium]
MIVGGRELETRVIAASTPDAPTLLFLHEGLGSAGLWRDVPDELARRTGCGAVAYSRYGNGRSEALREPRTPHYMHDEALIVLPDLIAALNVRDVVLVGHSDGASIALIYAAEHPAGVRGLVLEAPHVFVEDISVRSIAAAKVTFETTDLRLKLARHHANAERTFYGWNDIWLDPAFRDWNIEAYARRLEPPVLLVQGADDEYGTAAQVAAISHAATRSRVDTLLLARCGHSPHRDRREATLASIVAFVSESGEA